jgi:quercetin dioxygenase-like cupin family protein
MHEHPQEQVTIVIKGKIAVTSSKSGEVILEEGDVAFFSAHEPHMLKNCLNEPSIGIDIFHPARPFDFWLKRK